MDPNSNDQPQAQQPQAQQPQAQQPQAQQQPPAWGTPPQQSGWAAPGQQQPPAWGTPPSPEQPGWAAPGQQQPPAWGTPPSPEQPGWAVPQQPYSGTGMAGAVAGKVGGAVARRAMGAIGVVVLIVVIAGGYFIYNKVANPNHMGQVIYTTDDQTVATDCSTSNVVTTVKTGTHVWAVYMWSHRLSSGQAVVEEDFANGVSLGTYNIPTDKSSDADCLSVTDDLSNSFTQPGTYEIKLTVGSEVVADGKLTITP